MKNQLISINDVNYSYENGREFIFNNLNLSIPGQTITAILGMNGVGKTTLLLLILGFLEPNSGEVNLYSKTDYQTGRSSKKIQIAYLPQYERLPLHITVDEYILLGRVPYISPLSVPSKIDIEIIKNNEEILGLCKLGKIELGKISGGELQRVRICRALSQESEIILLDEPISHLDIKSKYAIMQILKNMKKIRKTIIFTSHDPGEALKISDQSILIYPNQQIKFGKTEKILTTRNLTKCLGIPIEILETDNGLDYQVINIEK